MCYKIFRRFYVQKDILLYNCDENGSKNNTGTEIMKLKKLEIQVQTN